MRFPDLLIEAIRSSEIPLRFEPGAEESVALPVTRLLRRWIGAHASEGPASLLRSQLLAELDGEISVPE